MMRTTLTRTFGLTAATALGVAGLAACSAEDGGSAAPGDAGEAGAYTIVFTAGATLVTDWDVYVAEDVGFFEENGVTVENVTTQTANDATQLLVTGEAQVSRGLAPMIQAINGSGGSLDLVDVADVLVRPPFELNVAEGIDSWDDLEGKNIGTSSETDNTTIVTLDALERQGVAESDVNLVTSGGTAARFAGLEGGALDASLLFPPISQQAADAGFPSLGYLPDLLGDDWKYSFSTIVVNRTWAADNPDALKAYMTARDQALEFLGDPANRQEASEILAGATDIEVETALEIYDLMHIGTPQSAFAPEIGIDEDAVAGTLEILQKVGQAPDDLTADELIDDSIAAQIRGE